MNTSNVADWSMAFYAYHAVLAIMNDWLRSAVPTVGALGEGFATHLGTKGYPVSNRMTQQIIHGGLIQSFQLQVTVLNIPNQQANAFQILANTLTDRLNKLI